MKVESGLSLLSRLVSRPNIDSVLGPEMRPLTSCWTSVLTMGDHQDMVTVQSNYILDLVTRTLLPRSHGEVVIGGLEAGLVMVDCCHQFDVETLTSLLQTRIRHIAETHFTTMRDAGVTRDLRDKQRLTSTDQWNIVKNSLSRLFIINVYNPDIFEISLISLSNLIMENAAVSAIIIFGVNSFYHQVSSDESISYNSYIRRLRQLTLEAVSDNKDQLRVLAVEMNIFGDSEPKHNQDCVIIKNTDTNISVCYKDSSSAFTLEKGGGVSWINKDCDKQ